MIFDDLRGRRIVVTGSTTGIGAAVAKACAGLGAHVAVHYNSSRTEAEALVATIEEAGGRVALVSGDVAKSEGAARVVEEAAAALGGLDV